MQSRFEDHLFASLAYRLDVCTSPLNCEYAGLQELLVCVFATDIETIETNLVQLLHNKVVASQKVLLCEP